jgi:type IV secretory pathway TrbD component
MVAGPHADGGTTPWCCAPTPATILWMQHGLPRTQQGLAPNEVRAISAHPLARRIATRRALSRQLALSGALLLLALAAGALAGRAAVPLILGAAVASCLFGLLLALAAGAVHHELVEAVARGELRVAHALAPAPLTGLLSPRNRETLARTLALCLQPASRRRHDIFAAPRAEVRRDPGLRRELEGVIERLRRQDAGPVGVALVHQLVTEAGSPLYGGTAEELRDRLGRIGDRLAEGERRARA